ncbi:hypothetical protein [Ornithinimicrobium pratense]|uniref:Uncharacterized protein n=1 Tax=Ornithinimicrobium pratense TaxID=2593973 RepID=A0A5J6V968_9MICO|nr:hypothetical protein [Ornithinimicrobium pratense]QFG69552.1 hypothetical protein FY030_13310 [Ornithinimicrobium pratense]
MPHATRHRVQLTLEVLAVALTLGIAAAASPVLLAVGLAACASVIAWGWAGALALPTPRGTFGVLALGGLALLAAVVGRDASPWLGWLPAAAALSMIAAFLHQLLRRDGRPRVVESVSAVVLALAVVGTGVLLVPASRTDLGIALVVGALAAAAASALTDLLGSLPAARPWLTPVALLAGAGAASAAAWLLGAPVLVWVLVGVASAALSHAARAVLGHLPTMAHPRPRLVAAIASVLAVGLVPYLVALTFVPGALPG